MNQATFKKLLKKKHPLATVECVKASHNLYEVWCELPIGYVFGELNTNLEITYPYDFDSMGEVYQAAWDDLKAVDTEQLEPVDLVEWVVANGYHTNEWVPDFYTEKQKGEYLALKQ